MSYVFFNLFSIFSLSVSWDIYNTLYIRILMSLLILRNACKPDMILTCIFIEWADSETVVYEKEQLCMCFHCHISYRHKFDRMAFGDLWHGKYEDISLFFSPFLVLRWSVTFSSRLETVNCECHGFITKAYQAESYARENARLYRNFQARI